MLTVTHGTRAAFAQRLEGASFAFPLPAKADRALHFLSRRGLTRPAPHVDAEVIAVGGATLGGSGKTPFVLALALSLAKRRKVAVVAHGYRGRWRSEGSEARWVAPDDSLSEVGDDALFLARALEGSGVRVALGRNRARALAFAAKGGGTLIVDGALSLHPAHAARRILALDAFAPWGSGALRPFGDLVASREALLATATDVVWIGDEASETSARGHHFVSTTTHVVDASGARVAEETLARLRLGAFTALARPARFAGTLRSLGVHPHVLVRFDDHGPVSHGALAREAKAHRLDGWIATEKCALHAPATLVVRRRLHLPPTLQF